MKFTRGQWTGREGIVCYNPAEVYDYEKTQESVSIFLPFKTIRDRADTLDQGCMTMKFDFITDTVVRVRFSHHHGGGKNMPKFCLDYAESGMVQITAKDEENSITIKRKEFTIHISKGDDFRIVYSYQGRKLTSMDRRSIAYIADEKGKTTYVMQQLSLGVGECVYGLGERFTAFVKNGQSVDIWNDDGGTASEIAYKNIPFYITSAGYGVFVNHTGRVSFEVASEQVERVQFSVEGEEIEYFIIAGNGIKEVVGNYTMLTGRAPVPPAWSYGLWLSTSFTTDYDEGTVCRFLDKMEQYEIPISVFHFDCFWMKAFHWCDFIWDEKVFPDPLGMLERLKQRGLKICVWINPYIAQRSILFDEGMKKGYLLKKKNGDIWQWDRWQAGMAIVDFTNPEAKDWYQQKLRQLLQMGVDCFKTDFGERIPENVVYYDGSAAEGMHNYYPFLYNQAVQEIMLEEKKEGVLFARSATVGCQRFPVHWGGDCWGSYESMAESLRGGLSLCLCGFGYWSHDIGGFETSATPDLYKRWAAFGLLSTHSRLHGSHSYRVPWKYDEEACRVLRYFTQLKYRLMPYIYEKSKENSLSGVPVMRPMIMEFERDKICSYLDQQYMLGDRLMVAPVFREDGIAEFYLPQGNWTNFITGKQYYGERYISEKCNYMEIPLLVRDNSIIQCGLEERPDYEYTNQVQFNIYELEDEREISATVYSCLGREKAIFRIYLKDGIYLCEIEGTVINAQIIFINRLLQFDEDIQYLWEHRVSDTIIKLGTVKDRKFELKTMEGSQSYGTYFGG